MAFASSLNLSVQASKALFITVLSIFLITYGSPAHSRNRPAEIRFLPGEKLTFEVRWAFIRAGEVVLEIRPLSEINGRKTYHFVMTSKTTPFIDIFYKVRDRFESYTDIGMTHALLYKKTKRGRRKKDIVVTLNWEQGQARYTGIDEEWHPIPLLPGAFDPLSVFYAFRRHNLREGKEITTPVTDGKKCVMGKALVIKREKIRVKGIEYDTYLVEPDLGNIGGVFEKSRGAGVRIWVTADDRQVPVRLESELALGSFVADLVSAEGLH
ncbi:MAG: DUF3108 domain-containing protein [Deltaproteobacteria bacterium]|nr:DUF3108 domain-containing protein [Deltaproteobacteria bacterium]